MRQFVLPDEYIGSGPITLTGEEYRYLTRVLRMGPGQMFNGVNQDGRKFILTINAMDEISLTADCVEVVDERDAKEDMPEIILIQCLPKGKKLEMIIRQAVEAGVGMVIPVQSEYSVPVIKEDRSAFKNERLKKIAVEAAQQSGNKGVPTILSPVKMKELPELLQKLGKNSGQKLFFHQEPLANWSLHRYLIADTESVIIFIGPEGGFSEKETDFLLASGFYPVYLGDNILRTETAAIYALGAVKTILLERKEWKAYCLE